MKTFLHAGHDGYMPEPSDKPSLISPNTGRTCETAVGRRAHRYLPGIVLAAITAAAFWVRIRNWPMVFADGGINFVGNDTLYHMRRVAQAVANGLIIPNFDPYLNFPAGLHPNWPPLFDHLIAAIALLLGRSRPDHALVETVGAITPPVLGALTAPAVYLAARKLMGRLPSLAAALAITVLPYAVQVSVLGRPDHHVAAMLCSTLLLWSALRTMEADSRRAATLNGILTGGCLFLTLGTWLGSLILIPAPALGFCVGLLLYARRPQLSGILLTGAMTSVITAGILFAPVVFTSYFYRAGIVAWDAPSVFHLFLLLGAACLFWAWRDFLGVVYADSLRRRIFLLVRGAAVFLCLAGAALRLNALSLLSGGTGWIAKKDPLLTRLVESLPLNWTSAAENFTGLVVILPVVLVWLVVEHVRCGRPVSAVLIAAWSAMLGTLTVGQERFSDMLSVVVAILLGKTLELGIRAVRRLGDRSGPGAVRARITAALVSVLLVLAAAWTAAPTARWLKGYWYSAPRLSLRTAVHDFCAWLRSNTPDPGGYGDGSKPAYSVLASWPYGHAITCLGGRPNVANPFVGWMENREANLAPYRFFVSDNPAQASALLKAYGVRYVVVTETLLSGHFADMLRAVGLRHEDFFTSAQDTDGPVYSPTPRTYESMVHRLYLSNGEGLAEYRLVYSSNTHLMAGNRELPQFKIFEVVGEKKPQ